MSGREARVAAKKYWMLEPGFAIATGDDSWVAPDTSKVKSTLAP